MATYKTLTTEAGQTTTLLNATDWTFVALRRVTVGPVVVGNVPQLGPVNQGKGVSLGTDVEYTIVPPGETLYAYSDANDSITLKFQTLPFIIGNVAALVDSISKMLSFFTGKQVTQSFGKKC